jgi:hypothetical protein
MHHGMLHLYLVMERMVDSYVGTSGLDPVHDGTELEHTKPDDGKE